MRTLIYLLILVFLLSACSIYEEPRRINPEDVVEKQVKRAKQLQKQGKYQKAAHQYQKIAAQVAPPKQQVYQFLAIKAFLKAGKLAKAKAQLSRLNVRRSYGLKIPLELVRVQIDLAEQRIQRALKRLGRIKPTASWRVSLQIAYWQLYARTLVAKGEKFEAIRKWMIIDKLPKVRARVIKKNHQQLWRTLSSVKQSQLEQMAQVPANEFSGWIALALLTKTSAQKHLWQTIKNWQRRFPNHPAALHIVPSLLQKAPDLRKLQQVALLLPLLDKRFGGYAESVKNGFFAAAGEQAPKIIEYAVNVDNILQVYQQAVKEGADFVVGPLSKKTIAVLANNQAQLPVPTLALNYLEKPEFIGNFYQFGLSPHDETQEVAKRAWANAQRLPLVLVPDGVWGEGILKVFQAEWEKRGGQSAVQAIIYDKNFESKIPEELKKIKTADMAFMVALPKQAPIIRQFLVSSLGDNLPIYSISRVYSGNLQEDTALENVIFVDMPWILAADKKAAQLQAVLSEKTHMNKRLYALGLDAYHLLSRLQQLSSHQWQGQTGRLSVNNRGIIHRDQLPWARLVNGKPQLLD